MTTNTTHFGQHERLGELVHRARTRAGRSVRGVAAEAGVDATWLSRLERGGYASPDPRGLTRVARVLDLAPADLYLAAGYSDGRGLPGFAPYLRARYALPDAAIAALQAHFDLLNDKYVAEEGGTHGHDPEAP